MFLVGLFERSSCEACAYSNVWSTGLSLGQAFYRRDGVRSLLTAWRHVRGHSWWVCSPYVGCRWADTSTRGSIRPGRQQWCREGKMILKRNYFNAFSMVVAYCAHSVCLFLCINIRRFPNRQTHPQFMLCV